MKTISSHRAARNRIRKPQHVFFGIAVFVLLLALLLWRGPLAGALWQVVGPLMGIQQTGASVVSGATAVFATKDELLQENMRLTEVLASTSAALADRNVLYKENKVLKERLGRAFGEKRILAGVLLAPPGMPYDTLMIDAGSADGIAVGDVVSGGGTTRIGRVADVYTNTARVILLSSSGEVYAGTLITESESIPLEVVGDGAGSLSAQVPVGVAVSVGDAVVFRDIGSGFGSVVSRVETKEGESFRTIHLQLAVNPIALRFVEIVKK